MAILSNINGKFAVDSTGAVQFSGAAGTSGYVLKSNGAGSAPTWVDGSTVIGGPYLPLSGGTLTGATATASGISFTVGGVLTGTSATFTGNVTIGTSTTTPSVHYDNLVIEDVAGNNVGISLISGTGNNTALYFGDSADTDVGQLKYSHSTNDMFFVVNASTAMTIDSSGDINSPDRLYMRQTQFGYSSAYKVVQFGNAASTSAISLGYNPSSNTNGGFSGNEILIPNNIRILAPNAADNQFYGVMMFDGNDKLLIGSSNYLIDSNYIMAMDPATKRVGIGTASPIDKLNLHGGATDNLGIQFNSNASGSGGGNGFRVGMNGTHSFMWNFRNTPLAFATGGTEKMTLTTSGLLGIGNTNPQTNLQVTSNTTTKLRVNTTGVADTSVEIWGYDAGVHIGDNGNGNRWAIWNDGPSTSSSLKFGSYALGTWYAPGSQVMTMTSDGKVGIGTTTPAAKFAIASIGNFSDGFSTLTNSDSGTYLYTNPNGRLLTSNASGWFADGRDPILTLSSSGNSNNTNIGNSIGLNLHNNSNVNGTFGPLITFSSLSESTSYNTAFAAIGGVKRGRGPDTNWSVGDLCFWVTGPAASNPASYMQSTPSMVIATGGNVGIGVSGPSQSLEISGNMAIRDTHKIYFNHNTNTNRYIGASSANDLDIAADDDINYRSNYNRFFNGGTEFARLSGSTNSWIGNGSNGQLGIGKTNPAYALDVNGGIASTGTQVSTATAPLSWQANGNTGTYTQTVIYANQSNSSGIINNAAVFIERGRLTNSASGEIRHLIIGSRGGQSQFTFASEKLGINNDSPSAQLHLTANASNSVPFKLQGHNSTSVEQMLIYTGQSAGTGWYNIVAQAGGINQLIIYGNGNIQNANNSYGQISDERLKENIVDTTPKLEDIKKIKVKNFNFIGDDLKQIGMIAQEVEEVFPGLVEEIKQPDVEDVEGGTYKSIKYSVLVPILIKAIQELEARVKELENK